MMMMMMITLIRFRDQPEPPSAQGNVRAPEKIRDNVTHHIRYVELGWQPMYMGRAGVSAQRDSSHVCYGVPRLFEIYVNHDKKWGPGSKAPWFNPIVKRKQAS